MAKQIPVMVTSKKAQWQLDRLIEHLEKSYSIEYADKFLQNFHYTLHLVKHNPMMFKAAKASVKNVRKGFAHKHISFYYRINKRTIRILYFKDNRSISGKWFS